MDEIKVFRALVQESLLQPSGVGGIGDAVWRGVAAAEAEAAAANGCDYINAASMRISSMAAAVILSCVVSGYLVVDNFLHGGAMLTPYYAVLDELYAVIWRML